MSDLDKDIDKDNYRNNVDKSILVVKDIRNSLKPTSVGYISIENVLKELETYKKIAEKLAFTILEMDVEEKDVYETICKNTPHNICDESEADRCDRCIIDWARKEVEKDEPR